MGISATVKKLLNTAAPGLFKAKLGDIVDAHQTKLDTIEENANAYTLPAAVTLTIGGVKKGVAVANATDAASAITQVNALLASLRTAGVITT
jgi:hypothetical protein